MILTSMKLADGREILVDREALNGQNGNGGRWVRAWLPLVAWVVSTLVAVMLTYASISTRLSVLEADSRGREQRLQRIEMKLDQLLELRTK